MQLPGDGADPPLLRRMQAQDPRNQVRDYGHGATLHARGAGHDSGRSGVPSQVAAWHSVGTARMWWSWSWWLSPRSSSWWPPCPQARPLRWSGVSMRPVEPQPPHASNPGASRSAAGHHRRRHHRRRHHHRVHGTVGASAATARRGLSGPAETVGTGVRSRAEPRRAPGDGTAGHSSGCHDRSGCTARPAHGNARTGTACLDHPCPPRSTTEAAVLDGRVPAVPH